MILTGWRKRTNVLWTHKDGSKLVYNPQSKLWTLHYEGLRLYYADRQEARTAHAHLHNQKTSLMAALKDD